MTNRNDNRKQPHTGGNNNRNNDTEFGSESALSKKARKKAARESRNS
ncbi:hypothetical protein HPT25_22425 [Bacillus sp. BRMEA1]|nr:hypothetical protein [Neobacillus endophyticus]NRD80098.1 hypothetical protein [Neobacillus endophyticus]